LTSCDRKRELDAHWKSDVQSIINQYQLKLEARDDYNSNCDYEQDWSLFEQYKNNF
jgi:hypothetical protein